MMRKTGFVFATAILMAMPLSAQERMGRDADVAIEGGGVLAEGWNARTDRGQNFDNVKFTDDHGTLEISVGPAIVAYRDEFMASGDYTVSATIEQLSSKGHGHGTGLIVGGDDILGPEQVYTYFLVRGDGSYIIKTRTGSETAEVMPWTEHESIDADELGTTSNDMSIQVMGADMIFSINGSEVHRAPKADLYHEGIYGIRLNHNLEMRISGLKATH
jgi:hypothetical protein